MENRKKLLWGIVALFVVGAWGISFISMKVVGQYFTPPQIMLIRCSMAYVSLLAIHPKFYPTEGLKQELLYMGAAISGTTLYVILINYALAHTMTSNVSVLSSTSPIFIALLSPLFLKGSKINKNVLIGFAIATVGTVCIVTKGQFSFDVSPLGDSLAISGAICWAIYSLLLRRNKSKYAQLYSTRRIVLYGIIAVIPICIFEGTPINISALAIPEVLFNMLFLGIGAYTACHVGWALVIKNMGPVWTSNFTYIEPVITIVFSFIFLGEAITLAMIAGTALILGGVIVSDGALLRKKNKVVESDLDLQIEEAE